MAGAPTYNPFFSVSLVIKLLAPIMHPFAILTPGSIVVLAPIQHPSSMIIFLASPAPALCFLSPIS